MLQKQRGDVDRIRKIASDQKLDVEQMLSVFLSASTPDGMSPIAYDLLSTLLRFPKPTYMIGLTKDAHAFLSKRLSENPPVQPSPLVEELRPTSLRNEIVLADMSISYTHDVAPSSWSNAIREAFGLEKTVATITGVRQLSIEVQPGELWYIWGPSGSGKTRAPGGPWRKEGTIFRGYTWSLRL